MLMKIACVAPDDLSTLIFCKTLSRMLASRNDTELFTISKVDLYRKELSEIDSTHIDVDMDRLISPLKDLRYFFRLYRIFSKEKFSTVVTFTTKPNIYGQLAAWLAGVPLKIMAVRGLGRTFDNPTTTKGRLLRWVMINLYRLSGRVSDLVWFTNINDRNACVDYSITPENKTFMTKNAIDPSDYCMDRISPQSIESLKDELNLKNGDLVIIMVARLIWSKGIKEFCEAAMELRTRLPNLHFLLVAPDEPPSPDTVPTEYIFDMETKANLKWLGFRKDVRELYALSDIATLPSYYKEGGYPRALLEPMAFGKPVIAADTPDCRSPVEDGKNGYVVPPRDSKSLANAIEAIAADPERRKLFGKHSLKRVLDLFDDKTVFAELVNRVFSSKAAH